MFYVVFLYSTTPTDFKDAFTAYVIHGVAEVTEMKRNTIAEPFERKTLFTD